MPGGPKLPKCPKGEQRDKKTKECVKVHKKSPTKKNSPKHKHNTTNKNRSSSSSNKTKKNSPKKKIDRNKNRWVTPKLERIKPDISAHDYKYLKETLENIQLQESEEGYNENTEMDTLYYSLSDTLDMLNDEIDKITKKHKSGRFAFDEDSSKVVIKELQRYIRYMKSHAEKDGRLNKAYIGLLFD